MEKGFNLWKTKFFSKNRKISCMATISIDLLCKIIYFRFWKRSKLQTNRKCYSYTSTTLWLYGIQSLPQFQTFRKHEKVNVRCLVNIRSITFSPFFLFWSNLLGRLNTSRLISLDTYFYLADYGVNLKWNIINFKTRNGVECMRCFSLDKISCHWILHGN